VGETVNPAVRTPFARLASIPSGFVLATVVSRSVSGSSASLPMDLVSSNCSSLELSTISSTNEDEKAVESRSGLWIVPLRVALEVEAAGLGAALRLSDRVAVLFIDRVAQVDLPLVVSGSLREDGPAPVAGVAG